MCFLVLIGVGKRGLLKVQCHIECIIFLKAALLRYIYIAKSL